MTVTDVSPAHQNTVGAFLQRSQNMMWRYSGRAHDPHRAHVGGILQTADTGQIRRAVSAPVTYEGQDFGFKQFLVHSCSFIKGVIWGSENFSARKPNL
jgi:hypothetical protein